MNQPTVVPQKIDYGLDTPKELRRDLLYGLVGLVMGPLILYIGGGAPLGIAIGLISLISGAVLVVIWGVMIWGSREGKLHVRDDVMAAIPWRGNERVLDIGCGHGLLMIGAAKHLTTGKAIGVDLWLQDEQANNSADAVLRNAALEGVSERVEVRNGDARDLSFDNESVDVVLCGWVIHHMLDPEDRLQVLKEIQRVLKPGGRVVIIDIDRIDEYRSYFISKDWLEITKSKPYYLFVSRSYILSAVKPTD